MADTATETQKMRESVERAVEDLNRQLAEANDAGIFVQLNAADQRHVVIEGFIYDHRRRGDGD